MTIALTESEEAYIRQKIESGQYKNASSVLQEAFHLLDVRDAAREDEREAVREGFAQIERGESVVVDDQYLGRILARAREELTREAQAGHALVSRK